MTMMRGWTKPTGLFGDRSVDHTWVTADDGKSCWPCAGGGDAYYCNFVNGEYKAPEPGDGGSSNNICSGDGDVAKANCVAGKLEYVLGKWPAYAGIVYGANGVCHQMANRVLASTNIWVTGPFDGARGCVASALAFGHYGTKGAGGLSGPLLAAAIVNWASFMVNCKIEAKRWHGLGDDPGALINQVRNIVSDDTVLNGSDIATALNDQVDRHMAEIKLTVDYSAGGQVDEKQIERLMDLYRVYHTTSKEVSQMARMGRSEAEAMAESLDSLAIATEINARHKAQIEEAANLLSSKEFETIYRQSPEEAVDMRLIDLSVFKTAVHRM